MDINKATDKNKKWILSLFECAMKATQLGFNCSLLEVGRRLLIVTVESLNHVWLLVTSRAAARQAPLSFTTSKNLLKFMSIESVMLSNHCILCHPLLLLPSVLPSFRVFSTESDICIRRPKYWSFSFNISPSSEYSGLISFKVTGLISLWGGSIWVETKQTRGTQL